MLRTLLFFVSASCMVIANSEKRASKDGSAKGQGRRKVRAELRASSAPPFREQLEPNQPVFPVHLFRLSPRIPTLDFVVTELTASDFPFQRQPIGGHAGRRLEQPPTFKNLASKARESLDTVENHRLINVLIKFMNAISENRG